MKPRIRPLSNLYHRWGKHFGLNAEQVAQALDEYNIIRRVGTDHYAEIPRKPPMDIDDFQRLIVKTLGNWRERHGL